MSSPAPTVLEIVAHVATFYELEPIDVLGKGHRPLKRARVRQTAMALSYELTPHSLISVGRQFGRDHTTVLHASRVVAERAIESERYRDELDRLRERILGTETWRQTFMREMQAATAIGQAIAALELNVWWGRRHARY